MRIAFICACLQPGRDGVGDYTRRLAIALQAEGVTVDVFGIHDPYVTETTEETQVCSDGRIGTVRLCASSAWEERITYVRSSLNRLRPDWISLQFVPYGFQKKGLPIHLPGALQSLFPKARNHVMFHELWVGPRRRLDLPHLVVAGIQKLIIRQLARTATCVHSQLPESVEKLRDLGLNAQALPLPANISFNESPQERSAKSLRLAFFSQADYHPTLRAFLKALANECTANDLRPEIHFCGKVRDEAKAHWMEALPGIEMIFHGWMPEAGIASLLTSCDAGVTPLPRHTLGKSGSTAAFIAAGLPVIAPVKGKDFAPFVSQELESCLVEKPSLAAIQRARASAGASRNLISLSYVAERMMSDLRAAGVRRTPSRQ